MDNLEISGIKEDEDLIIKEEDNDLIIGDDHDVVKIDQVNVEKIRKGFSVEEKDDNTIPRPKKATFTHMDSLEDLFALGRYPDTLPNPEDENFSEEMTKLVDRAAEIAESDTMNKFTGKSIDFKFAISEDGKTSFDSPEEFNRYMKDPKNTGAVFFVFDEQGHNPHCIKKEEDGFSVSEEGISTTNQLQNPNYRPRKTIALSDNLKLSNRAFHLDKLGEELKASNKELKKAKRDQEEFARKLEIYKAERLHNIITELCQAANKTEEEYGKVPEEFTEEKPVFPTGAKVQRFFFKLITLGFGETNKYKEFKAKLTGYTEREQAHKNAVETYRKEVKDFDERKNAKDEKLISLEESLEDAKNREPHLTARINGINDKMKQYSRPALLADQDQLNKLLDYHRKKEVILEGIADINEKGKLTQNNIFANNWLLKQSLDGKDPNNMTMDEYQNLASYVVGSMAEKQIYKNYVQNPNLAEGQMNNAILTPINNGVATESMLKNPHFVKEFKKWVNDDRKIRPEEFAKAVEESIEKEVRKNNSPLERLKAEREALEERFGRKALTEDVLLDYARYRVLSEGIDKMQRINNSGRPFIPQDDAEATNIIADVHMNHPDQEVVKHYPNGQKIKMNTKLAATDLRKYTSDEYKKALKNVIGRQEDTKKLTNEIKDSQKENMKEVLSGLNTDGKFTLPEIARFITAERENIKNAEKNPPVINEPKKL